MTYSPATNDDLEDLRAFLREADLTVGGLGSPDVRVWLERGPGARVIGSTMQKQPCVTTDGRTDHGRSAGLGG